MRVLTSITVLLVSATAKRFGRFDSATCALPKATGPCMAYFKRYFWNAESGECEEFVFGGCRGNGNNFESVEECERHCGAESSEESSSEWSKPFVPFFKEEKAAFMEKLAELRERFELRELFSEGDGLGSGAFNDLHEKFVDAHDKLVEKYPDGYDGVGSGLFADIHDKIVEVHDKLKDGEGFGPGSGGFLDFMTPDSEDVQNFKDEVKEATESWKSKFEEAFSHRYGAQDQPQKRPNGPWWKKQDESGEGIYPPFPKYPAVRAEKADRKPIVQNEESSDDSADGQQQQENGGLVAPTPSSSDPSEAEAESNDGQSKKATRKEEKKAAKKEKKAKQAEEDSPENPEDENAEEESVEQEESGLVAPTPISSDPSEEKVAGDEEVSSDAQVDEEEEEANKGKKSAKKQKKAKKAKKSDD